MQSSSMLRSTRGCRLQGAANRACTRRYVVLVSASKVYDAVIVGGGISGLTTAQALTSKHNVSNFLVTEARERVGGNITSMQGDGFIWEEGPNSFQPNDFMLQIAVCDTNILYSYVVVQILQNRCYRIFLAPG